MSYQEKVVAWGNYCFQGDPQALSVRERAFRFAEEAMELCQAAGISLPDMMKIMGSIYSREKGDFTEEVGGVMVTVALLCEALKISMEGCAEGELIRISQFNKILKIRARRAAQEPGSPVVGDAPEDRSNIYTPVKKGEGP